MVGARWLVASKVGVAVVDGRDMRATTDDQRLTSQPRAIEKKKTHIPYINRILQLPYRTVL